MHILSTYVKIIIEKNSVKVLSFLTPSTWVCGGGILVYYTYSLTNFCVCLFDSLIIWFSFYLDIGAVPVATLNLQQGVKSHQGVKLQQGGKSQSIPDAWHHQMVYGVGPKGEVFLMILS